jgi:hypothetical protein
MTRDAVLQLLHRGRQLASSVHASEEGSLGWIGVYPLDSQRPETATLLRRFGVAIMGHVAPVYRIRAFEVAKTLIEADVSISEDELKNTGDSLAIGDEDLESKLRSLGIELNRLDLPFKSNYPI